MSYRLIVPSLVGLALAGCGGSQPGAKTTTTTARTTAAMAAPAAAATSARVAIEDFDYAPRRIVVARGATVTWTDRDQTNHTVTFGGAGPESPGDVHPGGRVSARFTRAGTFTYLCDYHPNMHGAVVVR